MNEAIGLRNVKQRMMLGGSFCSNGHKKTFIHTLISIWQRDTFKAAALDKLTAVSASCHYFILTLTSITV